MSKEIAKDKSGALTKVDEKVGVFNKQVDELNKSQESFSRILSGVKTYGTLAEFGLGSLIKDLIPSSQYIENARMKPDESSEAVEFAAHAKEAGATAALHVTPYYNKPTQAGMYRHFSTIADSVDLPIIIYNIPPRSIVDMSLETMGRLAKHKNVVGVKDATQDLVRPLATRLEIGADFCQLSGEDATIVPYLSQGGHGCISVTCNVAPGPLANLHKA